MTKTANDILEAVKNAENILVCGHIRPDGDCIGAALAMRRMCLRLGKKADAVCDADKPSSFCFLPDYESFCQTHSVDYDLFIAVDCTDEKRLGKYKSELSSAKMTVNIDHHPTNTDFCQINCVDPTSSSTCALLFELFGGEDGLIDSGVAELMFTGLSTDTGCFMHSNTDARAFSIAERLCRYGISAGRINHDIYCNKSLNKIKLTSRALDGIKMYGEGKIALLTVTLDDLAECGCDTTDTEGLIDFASSISGVAISIAICEQPGNLYRVSFRSVSCDVAAVAETFGGGGHKAASGCVIKGDRYDVINRVIAAASAALS